MRLIKLRSTPECRHNFSHVAFASSYQPLPRAFRKCIPCILLVWARCYLLCKGSSLGEGLRGPKGLEGEAGFEPLCCEWKMTLCEKFACKTSTFQTIQGLRALTGRIVRNVWDYNTVKSPTSPTFEKLQPKVEKWFPFPQSNTA